MVSNKKEFDRDLLIKARGSLADELDAEKTSESATSPEQNIGGNQSPTSGGKVGWIGGALLCVLALSVGGYLIASSGSRSNAETLEQTQTSQRNTTDNESTKEETANEERSPETNQTVPELPFKVGGFDAADRPIPELPEILIPNTPNANSRAGYPDDPVNVPTTGPYMVIEGGIFYLRGRVSSENVRQHLIADAMELIPAEGLVIEYIIDNNDPWYDGDGIPAFLNDRVLFRSGSNTVSEEFTPIAVIGTSYLATDPNNKIRIIGHTDDVGDADSNLALSRLRAEAVAELFAELGAPGEQIIVEAKGETEPIADNTTEAGRKANRRVDFSIRTETSKSSG